MHYINYKGDTDLCSYQNLLELQNEFQLRAEEYFNSKIKDKDDMVFHHVEFFKNAVKIHWNTNTDHEGNRAIELNEFLNFK